MVQHMTRLESLSTSGEDEDWFGLVCFGCFDLVLDGWIGSLMCQGLRASRTPGQKRFGLFWFVVVLFGLLCFALLCFGLVWFGLVWFEDQEPRQLPHGGANCTARYLSTSTLGWGLVWFGLAWVSLVLGGVHWRLYGAAHVHYPGQRVFTYKLGQGLVLFSLVGLVWFWEGWIGFLMMQHMPRLDSITIASSGRGLVWFGLVWFGLVETQELLFPHGRRHARHLRVRKEIALVCFVFVRLFCFF
jgi:hypothetical protein